METTAENNIEIGKLKEDNARLLSELKQCYSDIENQTAVLSSVKKDLRRYEVQINSLKVENDNFKRKFSIIENNFIGSRLLNVYRKYKNVILRFSK
ncbi:MAG: hypothetical protein MR390_08950 [Oscillospiraceae bacterium]|nr:hypothetical protein [Oscillospiraceae bacterium]MDY3937450.1 hypothetical protein [Oscillospiraceae bacterium]